MPWVEAEITDYDVEDEDLPFYGMNDRPYECPICKSLCGWWTNRLDRDAKVYRCPAMPEGWDGGFDCPQEMWNGPAVEVRIGMGFEMNGKPGAFGTEYDSVFILGRLEWAPRSPRWKRQRARQANWVPIVQTYQCCGDRCGEQVAELRLPAQPSMADGVAACRGAVARAARHSRRTRDAVTALKRLCSSVTEAFGEPNKGW